MSAGWKTSSNDEKLIIDANDKEDAATISSLLIAKGISLYHLALKKPSLEETFLMLTGEEN